MRTLPDISHQLDSVIDDQAKAFLLNSPKVTLEYVGESCGNTGSGCLTELKTSSARAESGIAWRNNITKTAHRSLEDGRNNTVTEARIRKAKNRIPV